MFETVEFIGLNDVDSQALVEFYHKEGVENRLASIIDKRVKKKLACKPFDFKIKYSFVILEKH